jgi:hypothetical protein
VSIIKKGTKLKVTHSRSGKWKGIATETFDEIKIKKADGFYPIALNQDKPVKGLQGRNKWFNGDSMPCRASMCSFLIDEPMPLLED